MEKSGKNLNDLLDLNRAQVMHYLAQHRGCSRAELGAATGLTLASITKIVRSLVECGVVYETGYAEGKKGRRSVGLSLNYEKHKILAIKLSWQRLELRPYDFLGNAYGQMISIPIRSISMDTIGSIMDLLADGIQNFCDEFPEIASIGMAVPGPYYRETGTILLPPYSKDPKKRFYYPLLERLSSLTSLPIFLEHDADAGALAYWWFYSNTDSSQVIMNILADEGIGVGLVDSGKIFTGTSNCSCEMGHITIDYKGRTCNCGSNGCLNAYCCSKAIEDIASEQLNDYPDSLLNKQPSFSMKTIFQALDQNDAFAKKIIKDAGNCLGQGIVSLLHVFDPADIVISGSLALGGELLLEGIQEALTSRRSGFTLIPEIKLFDYSQNLTLLGAAAIAIDSMLNQPTKYMSLSPNNI